MSAYVSLHLLLLHLFAAYFCCCCGCIFDFSAMIAKKKLHTVHRGRCLHPSADAASAMADAVPVREREAPESDSPQLHILVRPLPPLSFLPNEYYSSPPKNSAAPW